MDKLTASQSLAVGLFVNPDLYREVSGITSSSEMPEGPGRELMALFEDISHEGKEPTLDAVAARMGRDLRSAIVELHKVCISTSAENTLYYARQVHQFAVSDTIGPLLVNAGYDMASPGADVLQILSEVRVAVEEAIQGFSTGDTAKSWQDCITEFLAELQTTKPRYKKTGFGSLDMFIGGYCPGDFNVIAARSGGGKSDIAVTLAMKAARGGTPVLYESLEMYRTELTERAVSAASKVPSPVMRDKAMTQAQFDTIAKAADALFKIKGVTVDAPSRLTVSGLEAMIGKYRPSVVFLDNLDLLAADQDRQDKWRMIEENCHAIKSLAKRTHTCIVGLVQLNRTVDSYGDGTPPKMADLYGGSAIEHDASWVVALKKCAESGYIDAHVLKSRAGRSGGKVTFAVDFDTHRWQEVETRYD